MQVQTSPAEERGDTWHLRREKGTLASISLALRLTLNHGGEIHTHTHRLWPCCSGGAKTREARENRKVEEKWDLSLPSFFSPSHFRLKKKKDSLKEKMYFVASGMAKKRGRKRTCLEWEQGVCLWWLNASVDAGEASGLARPVCYRGSPGPRGAEPGGGWRARALARGEMRGQWAGEGFTFHMKNLISPKNIQHIDIRCHFLPGV